MLSRSLLIRDKQKGNLQITCLKKKISIPAIKKKRTAIKGAWSMTITTNLKHMNWAQRHKPKSVTRAERVPNQESLSYNCCLHFCLLWLCFIALRSELLLHAWRGVVMRRHAEREGRWFRKTTWELVIWRIWRLKGEEIKTVVYSAFHNCSKTLYKEGNKIQKHYFNNKRKWNRNTSKSERMNRRGSRLQISRGHTLKYQEGYRQYYICLS